MHGVVFVGCTDEEEDVAVEFEVPLRVVVVCVVPCSNVWEFEDEELVMVAFVAFPATVVPIPKMVVDPRVVVRVEEPLVKVERIADVVIAEEVGEETVMVEAYER